MEDDIVFEIIKELEVEFNLIIGEEKIKEWQNFLNKWYNKELDRYHYELQNYIISNLNDRINKKLETMKLSDEDRLEIFKRFNNSTYRKGLFIGECKLLSGISISYDFVEERVNKNDFLTVGSILSNVKNAVDIYGVLECNWKYQFIPLHEFNMIINQIKNTENNKLFDLLFDELCLRDAQFGYSFISFLYNNSRELNATNILSMVKSIYIGGDDIRYIDKHMKKSSIILNLIKTNKLSIDCELSKQFEEMLRETSQGNMSIINSVVDSLSKDKKEKMKFYYLNKKV